MVSNFIDATKESVRTGLCNYLSFAGKGRSWVNELSPVDLPDFGNFWNRVLCDRNEPLPPGPPPPFTGGQCPVEYRVTVTRTLFRENEGRPPQTTTTDRDGQGPISGVFVRTSGGGAPPGRFESSIIIAFADGEVSVASTFVDDGSTGYVIDDVSVVRTDGQPDNCGNPTPPVVPFPPTGDTVDIDITYVNNEGDNVTELGDLVIFAPVVIAPVTVVAPIRIDLPDVSFNGDIVLSPDFDVRLRPPSFRRGPGGIDSPPPPENPDTSPTTPQDDSTRRIIGAIATVTSDPSSGLATEISSDDGPDLFVPRMGTLSFRVRADTALSWTAPVDIKTTRQFISAPENVQILDAVASPNPNYSISVSLVYSDSEPPA